MPVVTTRVLEIEYADHGAGPPVVLVHGWPDAARGWDAVATGLVAAGHRVVVPSLRGSGATRFRQEGALRDGTAVALAQDVLDLADALHLDSFAVVGHDWGARTAYTLAVVAPERLTTISALALAFQPRGVFEMPGTFLESRLFWYQWLMYLDAGVDAIAADPVGFAREQWDTWSPPGWYQPVEFAATAQSFHNPDWVAITLHAYRSRFLPSEPVDPAYDDLRATVAATEQIALPTLMIHGGADTCDPPETSEGQQRFFGTYQRVVLPGVGHFPHREAPEAVLAAVVAHLDATH